MDLFASRFEDFKITKKYDIIFSLANDDTIDGNTEFTFHEYEELKLYNKEINNIDFYLINPNYLLYEKCVLKDLQNSNVIYYNLTNNSNDIAVKHKFNLVFIHLVASILIIKSIVCISIRIANTHYYTYIRTDT